MNGTPDSDRELDARVADEIFHATYLNPSSAGVLIPIEAQLPRYGDDIREAYSVETHIAELGLQEAYEHALLAVVERDTGRTSTLFDLIHATAQQRCEAALGAVRSAGERVE